MRYDLLIICLVIVASAYAAHDYSITTEQVATSNGYVRSVVLRKAKDMASTNKCDTIKLNAGDKIDKINKELKLKDK
jgi:CRISPR/Cas system-associated endonuclease Cas3-HD